MDTVEFLRRVLPETGLYIIARLTGKGFRHQVCDSIEEAAQYALQFDAQGVPTYHACAAYRERSVEKEKADGTVWHQVRIQANVRALRAFWLDLDVELGNPKKFESQEAAIDSLVAFCDSTGLELPMVVSSGSGIHCYWTLTEEINGDTWKQTAEALKALCVHYEFRADPAVTGDPARILRPIGTSNRKQPGAPARVELVTAGSVYRYADFQSHILAALHAAGIKPPEAYTPREATGERLNEAFSIQQDFPPCSARKVADRCAQLARVRDTRGCVPEPHWYAAIQLMANATEGEELIHEWSSGYAGYSRSETDSKIAQVRGMGPPLCKTFESRNPGGCDTCPFKDKISSPAQLGATVKSAPPPVVDTVTEDALVRITLPTAPPPFTRGEHGGIYVEDEGVLHKIYEYDCFPTELAWDEHFGYETVRLRHYLPKEGWKECTVRSSLIAKPADFEAALRDNHIVPLIRNRMSAYLDSFMRKLREESKIRKLFKSMGWKENDTEFVLGSRLYRATDVVSAGHSQGTGSFLGNFHTAGSHAVWRDLTSVLGTPGLEPYAFMLLIAFVAPLLKLGNRQGLTVAMCGRSGTGKSTMGQFLASVYGHPTETWVKRDSTANALSERIGSYGSVPVYMDEITTIEPKELRNLVYRISTGVARDRLKQDGTMREGAQWTTLLVTSTNDSLQSKLQMEKANPEAEAMRLFEIDYVPNPLFGAIAADIRDTVAENYGWAGAEYIRRIVAEREAIKAELRPAIERIASEFGMAAQERFWTQTVALALYGGQLARKWGLIDFDPDVVRPWLMAETRRMRLDLSDSVLSAVDILGEYLNEHIGERLVVSKLNEGMTATGGSRLPTRGLSQRYERDTNLIFFGRSHFKAWLARGHHSYSALRNELYTKGILLNPDARKNLGAGTDLTGDQVPCWKIAANHPELGAILPTEGIPGG